MTLAEIAERTGLTTRQLRYVLEHDVLPGVQDTSKGRGCERGFTEFSAFGIACAAMMFRAGLRRSTVKRCIAMLCPGRRKFSEMPLYLAFMATGQAALEVADSHNLRLESSGNLRAHNFDTNWRQIDTGAVLESGYRPDVIVRIDVAKLRDKLKG